MNLYLSPPRFAAFGTVEDLFTRFRKLTNDDVSSSILTLAHVLSEQRDEPGLLDTAEVAGRLDVSQAQVQALCRAGQLRHVRVGRLMKFKPEYVDEYLRPAESPGRHWN